MNHRAVHRQAAGSRSCSRLRRLVGDRPKLWEINCSGARWSTGTASQVRISASAGGVTLAELHEVPQIRTRILTNNLADNFARWYPGFTHHSGPVELVA